MYFMYMSMSPAWAIFQEINLSHREGWMLQMRQILSTGSIGSLIDRQSKNESEVCVYTLAHMYMYWHMYYSLYTPTDLAIDKDGR